MPRTTPIRRRSASTCTLPGSWATHTPSPVICSSLTTWGRYPMSTSCLSARYATIEWRIDNRDPFITKSESYYSGLSRMRDLWKILSISACKNWSEESLNKGWAWEKMNWGLIHWSLALTNKSSLLDTFQNLISGVHSINFHWVTLTPKKGLSLQLPLLSSMKVLLIVMVFIEF